MTIHVLADSDVRGYLAMDNQKLTAEERELLESVERDEWRRIPDFEKKAERYAEYARATFRKDKRINIRISERDWVKLQQRAREEGIPYQTLVSSVLHKYLTGRVVEKQVER
jgi:predicted DNA binding CopG/RHH family protein